MDSKPVIVLFCYLFTFSSVYITQCMYVCVCVCGCKFSFHLFRFVSHGNFFSEFIWYGWDYVFAGWLVGICLSHPCYSFRNSKTYVSLMYLQLLLLHGDMLYLKWYRWTILLYFIHIFTAPHRRYLVIVCRFIWFVIAIVADIKALFSTHAFYLFIYHWFEI